MSLGLGTGDFDKIGFTQPLRLRQNWFCNRNIVIAGKTSDNFRRCVVNRRKPLTEFGERFSFNPLDQLAKDVIENIYLLIGKTVSIVDEEIGDAAQ